MTFREEINTFGEGTIMRKAELLFRDKKIKRMFQNLLTNKCSCDIIRNTNRCSCQILQLICKNIKAEISIIFLECISGAVVNSIFAEMLCIHIIIFDKYQPLEASIESGAYSSHFLPIISLSSEIGC